MDTRDGRVENGHHRAQEMSPPRLSVCHPSWASDSLLGTLLFILGSIAAQPPQATAQFCNQGERVLAPPPVLGVGLSCRTGVLFLNIWLGLGGGAGSLKILAGVLVHRATRPQRQSVFRVVVAGRYLVCRFN